MVPGPAWPRSRLDLIRDATFGDFHHNTLSRVRPPHGQHLADAQTNYGNPMTLQQAEEQMRSRAPEGFTKTPGEVMGPGDGITYPARTTQLDYEGEVAVVIIAKR